MAVGETYPDPPPIGSRVVTMVSLTLTPLRLEAVGEVDCASPHVPVTGTAYLASGLPWIAYPDDDPVRRRAGGIDVCNAASQTRSLIDGDTRHRAGAGRRPRGACSPSPPRATRLATGGRVVLIDSNERICERARGLELCDVAIRVDLRDALEALRSLEEAGVPRADLTVVVVNSADCEAAAILLTADHGTVLFFSMATSFTKAALGSDGLASTARMLVGSGHAPGPRCVRVGADRSRPALQRAIAGG